MEYRKLKELIDIKTGKLDANANAKNGKYPFFTCSKDTLKIDTYSYDCECVLLAGNGDLNVKYYKGKFDAYQRTYILECKNNSISTKYLYYFMNKYVEVLRNQSIGGVIKYIKLANISEATIPMYNAVEQEKIVKEISQIEKIIDIRKTQLEKLDKLIKSQFVEMFGDPILNPLKWDVKRLGDISSKIMSGNTPKGGNKVYINSGIEFYRSQNVWKNKIEKDDIVYIDNETHKKMAKSSLKHNDLLITKTGRINTENSSLGRTALYTGEDDKANINGHVYLVRLNKYENHEFVLRILISDAYRQHIRNVCVGGIDKRQLNKDHIENFPIIYPPIDLQNKFVEFAKQVDKQKFEIENSLKEMQELYESLMEKYFG